MKKVDRRRMDKLREEIGVQMSLMGRLVKSDTFSGLFQTPSSFNNVEFIMGSMTNGKLFRICYHHCCPYVTGSNAHM